MNIFLVLVVLLIGKILYAKESLSLINEDYIRNYLTHEAPYYASHGASDNYLGAGLLYYALAYSQKAKVCVCLGSGGGFVPRVMCQSQRDLHLTDAITILVDGNIGNWGRPLWLSPDSFFRTNFPEIKIILDTTHHAAMTWDKDLRINYLHIDADHSLEGSWQDFIDYLPLMAPYGIITFHDTQGLLPCAKTVDRIIKKGFEVVNFKEFGAGVAIIHLGKN